MSFTTAGFLAERAESATRKWTIIPYMVILAIVSCGAVCARLWTRRVVQKQFGLEDWLIGVGMVLTLAILGGIVLAVMHFGFDKHTSDLTASQLVLAAEWLFVGEFAYVSSVGSIKVGILLFYRRLGDRRVSNLFINVLYFHIAFILLYKFVYLIVILCTCKPLPARWRRMDPEWASTHHFTCINEDANIFVGSTISATEDLVIALLPTWLFWRLTIPFKQKLAIWSIFAVSMATSAAGYVRSYFIIKAGSSSDHIWEQYWLWTCSGIELSVGLICASAPALKLFCEHYGILTRITAFFRPITNSMKVHIWRIWSMLHRTSDPSGNQADMMENIENGVSFQAVSAPSWARLDSSNIQDGHSHDFRNLKSDTPGSSSVGTSVSVLDMKSANTSMSFVASAECFDGKASTPKATSWTQDMDWALADEVDLRVPRRSQTAVDNAEKAEYLHIPDSMQEVDSPQVLGTRPRKASHPLKLQMVETLETQRRGSYLAENVAPDSVVGSQMPRANHVQRENGSRRGSECSRPYLLRKRSLLKAWESELLPQKSD